jgi:signal transduction histidine kinase
VGHAIAQGVRRLLNWRSLRWKIAALTAVACCGVAPAIGILVHKATVHGRLLLVQMEMGTEMRDLRALDRHVLEYSLAVLAIVVPLAALAAELPNRRLRRVARTARRIADGDLDARATRGGRGGDEIAEISVAVDAMAGALQERLLSEQRFTADVAHELRTPLMRLVTSTELLPQSEATELVRDRVRALRSLVEDLLEITRIDAGAERADLASVPLDQVTEESVRRAGVRARLTVTGDPIADTDPRRLDGSSSTWSPTRTAMDGLRSRSR